jgi:hypothetical protein
MAVARSESDDLMFRHAGKCGAQIFDGVKINIASLLIPDVRFLLLVSQEWYLWSLKFDCLVDASGRPGIVSTEYLKNRKINEGLKNIANWGYWKGAGCYAIGTEKENQPFFEALTGETPSPSPPLRRVCDPPVLFTFPPTNIIF